MNLKRKTIVLLSVIICAAGLHSQNRVLYRYSADLLTGSNLLTPVSLSSVTVSDLIEDEETAARGNGGWGFVKRKAALFNSASSAVNSTANVQTSFFGDFELSGELWIKPSGANGAILSWDDTSKTSGLNIFLDNARLSVQMRLGGNDYLVKTQYGLVLSEWHYVNWTISRKGANLNFAIYLDNKSAEVQQYTVSDAGSLVALNTQVSLGWTPNSKIVAGVYSGYLHAANIKNYIPDAIYLKSPLPVDGSSYFGLPNYHDYPLGASDKPVDKRITVSPTPILQASFVPYQNDGFMAQGITNTHEDPNYAGDEFIYISMYHKTATGQTGLKRSLIVEIDPNNNYTVRRCFRLMGNLAYAHVGGIAFKNNSIYISSASKIEIYPIPEYKSPNDKKYIDLGTSSSNVFQVVSVASFCTYFNDTLWIGDYRLSSSGYDPYLFGYRLDAAGKVVTTEAPVYYRLPFNTQGVAWRKQGADTYLFISQSGGDAGSKVHRVKKSSLTDRAIPAFDTTFQVPAGGEDLSFDKNGDLLNVSESGSLYMQKGDSPYTSFFPFIFSIDDSVLFKGKITSVKEESRGQVIPGGYEMKAFPNPFNSASGISVTAPASGPGSIKVYNTLGQEVATVFSGMINKGKNFYSWNADRLSSGTFFLAMNINGAVKSTCKLVLMK
jgi:hypothetical protein